MFTIQDIHTKEYCFIVGTLEVVEDRYDRLIETQADNLDDDDYEDYQDKIDVAMGIVQDSFNIIKI